MRTNNNPVNFIDPAGLQTQDPDPDNPCDEFDRKELLKGALDGTFNTENLLNFLSSLLEGASYLSPSGLLTEKVIDSAASSGGGGAGSGGTNPLIKLGSKKTRTRAAANWVLDSSKSATKWKNQFQKRGWTAEQVTEAIADGKSYSAINNINPGNSATRYVHPQTGRSVVIDDVTREVIHVGGDGFEY